LSLELHKILVVEVLIDTIENCRKDHKNLGLVINKKELECTYLKHRRAGGPIKCKPLLNYYQIVLKTRR